jgi:hypothetical protein
MAVVSSSASSRITNMASSACVELLADYGVQLVTAPTSRASIAEGPVLFGVVGFVGSGLSATCLLGAQQRLVEASCRSGSRPRDWIAELANQLIGRVKLKLLTCGVTVTMTTPLTLSGVQLTPLPRLGQEPLVFESQRGSALVWLELETEEQFVLPPEEGLEISPGDLVF